ncbi:site-specific integrase [Danxiaibacter flavus]|uniref:Site-specific integrase n=1 Tax=Danxiaibacter flavus TaxID=3049108 RepID=A0ABV3ZH75_9BACT|nr:site-specific integrase [Chitinophagaceae bacterium DXS]
MNISIVSSPSRDKSKIYYYLSWGRGAGQRKATGIFTFSKPKDQLQKNHNKEALAILEMKRSQMVLDRQSIASGYVPEYKLKSNFLDYYNEFVKANRRSTNRHLQNSMSAFKEFLGRDFISPGEINENLCERFRNYLLDNYNGETPSGYFTRFKKLIRAATKDGYFKNNPAEEIEAKTGKNKKIKEILSVEEYTKLMKAPCLNYEVKKAFIFSLYSGLRWAEVKKLQWESIKDDSITVVQSKTGNRLQIPLHPVLKEVIGERGSGLIFKLPTAEGANKVLSKWVKDCGIEKHITWHSARHSFSVLLQRNNVDVATVAGLLGHTTSKYVQQTYKRYIQNSAVEAIFTLPE